ncbi:MAG: translation initiation factor IF-2, partial [Bacilli bacterium]|nr:translation initiation factor IF-2 [Bacilli bacterium]
MRRSPSSAYWTAKPRRRSSKRERNKRERSLYMKKNNYNSSKKRNNGPQNRVSNVSSGPIGKKKDFAKVNGGVFVYTKPLSVGELSKAINVPVPEIIKFLFMQGKAVTINQLLDDDSLGEVCLEFGYDFRKEKVVDAAHFEDIEIFDDEKDLKSRPAVVTIMGHVDHGKTTLIDAIRNSHIVDTEAGGISQEIGAYQKEVNGQKITFIDTPGHAAFTAMRARGASVTDIVVLVVAADDGVMPQTIEAIDHAKAAGVPIIVAINKMDKPGANPRRVEEELMAHDVISEAYGGDVIVVEISAKKGTGIDDLLEMILLKAEMLDLKANPSRYAIGTVLEAELDKGVGPKATLLVQNGTLTNADYVVVGETYGKIRRMTNEHRQVVKSAGP